MKGQKITRNRAIKSCRYCYEHKLKCDKERPCSTCVSLDITAQCIYGFDKISDISAAVRQEKSTHLKNNHKKFKNSKNLCTDSVIYKSKFFYPFFTSSINDKIISADHYSHLVIDSVIRRNEITKFDVFSNPARNIDDVLVLLPSTQESAMSQIETYFDCIHPVIPILDRKKIDDILSQVYRSLRDQKNVNALNILLLMAIFFCSSYAAVALGVIPDLLLCNNYYRAYRYLLDVAEFPMRPLLESLTAFVIVNFVIDPNMVNATAYSAMLVRMGQQLGLHKTAAYESQDIKLLWNFLLYIEGSSSVVCGFSFSIPSELMNCVPLPVLKPGIIIELPIAYAIGRCNINVVFRQIMELTSRTLLRKAELDQTEERIAVLYKEVCLINDIVRISTSEASDYFACTLNIFLYRLHLRYYALLCLHSEQDKVLRKTSKEIAIMNTMDITGILELKQTFREEVIHLSILLLFHTCKRLVQSNIDKYIWYTRGSTVMQYLFVIIKDIYQNPEKSYKWCDFPAVIQQTVDADIRDVMNTNSMLYKYVLVEVMLGLMELKLASLWSNEELYKFLLVKTLKEKVWQAYDGKLQAHKENLQSLKTQGLFLIGMEHLQNMKTIDFEEYLKTWESDKAPIDLEKILTNWLLDFHQR